LLGFLIQRAANGEKSYLTLGEAGTYLYLLIEGSS